MENVILEKLISDYPCLEECRNDIVSAYTLIEKCYGSGGKLLCCGNGGSSADCDHLVGELMKGFLKKRPLDENEKKAFKDSFVADGLQKGLPAFSLTSQSALMTAFENDCEPSLVFAQQVYALAQENDVLVAFSTSGNSGNVVYALESARACGTASIAITGKEGGKCADMATVCIKLPATETYRVQELTLPVYHCLAAMIEDRFFKV